MTDLLPRKHFQALENCIMQTAGHASHIDELPLTNYFAPGVYVRQVFMKAGTLLTTKLHKTEHVAIVSCGTADVYCDGEIKRIVGPCTFITKPGTKRTLLVYEDMIWSTIHVTDKTDADEIVEEFTVDCSYEEMARIAQ